MRDEEVRLLVLSQLLVLLSLLLNICNAASPARVTIVHTCDVHLRFAESGETPEACREGSKCHGGLARFVKFVETLKEARSNSLVVDSGGLIPGRLLEVPGGREAVVDLVKPLPYDIMAFGALELADGIDALAEYVKVVGPKFVCTNIEFSPTFESGRYLETMCHKTMIKMYGELQIGVLSYIDQDALVQNVPGITITDEVTALEAGISELEATSADIAVILVLGYSHKALDETVLKKVPKINLIISGHSYRMFYNGTPPSGAVKDFDYPHTVYHPEDVNNSRPVPNQMVAGAYFHMLYAGKLKLMITGLKVTVDPESASNPAYMDGEKDPATEQLVIKHQSTFDNLLGQPLGFSTFLLDGSRECHRRECSMGNLLADSMVKAAILSEPPPPPGSWAISALALLSGTHIAASLERGAIYGIDLHDALRNDTSLELLRLNGAELRLLLEESVGRLPAGSEAFLQVSGVQVTGLVPAAGHRPELNISVVCSGCLMARFQPLQEEADYTAVVTSELAGRVTAPDGVLAASAANRTLRLHDSLLEAVTEYISKASPLLVGTGDRLMVPTVTAAAGPAPAALPAALLMTVATLTMTV